MKRGYSYGKVSGNAALFASGIEKHAAWKLASAAARADYFEKHPGGYLPQWLQFPRGRGLAHFYDAEGRPVRTNPARHRGTRGNTARKVLGQAQKKSIQRHIAQAQKLGYEFSGHHAKDARLVAPPRSANVALAIGPVLGIMYSTKRDGVQENYIHRFKVSSRPLLVVTPDGKQLIMLGGAYRFTDRGIVDA